ncbi:glycosyltransferase [Pseudomonas sp.]|uniref:glycosyltransferase n=1 Tax=Pseudomonas sp. TaxID=306 RepID=UPI0028A7717B|nr:glycosyltransferase [Pseudomonas sp.]
MNDRLLVSIAIPAFNPEFFRGALLSAINQDYPHLEIVICDDSSGPEIEAICEELAKTSSASLRYVRNHQRLGFARNLLACLNHASGEMIKFLCDDDSLVHHCISRQANVLQENEELSIVIGQRLLCDADDILLPSRLLNCLISPTSAVLHGTDLLACVADNTVNLFGGISHALFRRAQVEEYLGSLVQDGKGFVARLDMALYICLLRRGHLASLDQLLSFERMHPGRLSHQVAMTEVFACESEWLLQMLAARTSEKAPAEGYVRYLPLVSYHGADPVWEELDLRNFLTKQIATFNQQVGTSSLDFAALYAEWLECRSLSEGQQRLLPKRIEQWPCQPRIMPVVFCHEDDELALRATLDSLTAQSYVASRILLLGPAGSTSPAVAGVEYQVLRDDGFGQINTLLANDAQADWILLLQAGDRLHPHALVIMAERMALRTDMLCLYSDEGTHDGRGPSMPIFKPDFNLDLMRSLPYVGRQLAFKCEALSSIGGFDEQYAELASHDVLWRLVETHGLQVVEHIPEVLVQSQYSYADWMRDPAIQAQAAPVVRAHLQRLGVLAQVDSTPDSVTTRVRYQHPQSASVSILIPVCADLLTLRRCVESLFEHTRYGAYEVLLIANGDESAEVQGWLKAMEGLGGDQLRVVGVQSRTRAESLNQASEQARGDYLLLLDAQCALFDAQWLDELMLQAQRPEVGVVGPKLFGRDGTVAAGALVLGLRGLAGNPFVGCVDSSYLDRLNVVQNWSALSLNCLMVRRTLFRELQGLDTDSLRQSWLDADLCLRVHELGYLVVWTPFSKVARLGMASAASAIDQEADQQAFYQRWLPKVACDPNYNRNLSLTQGSFNLEPGLRTGWDPFIDRAMPSVLALPFNASGVGHYRVIQPFSELERAGWIQGRLSYSMPKPVEAEREKPDVIIIQLRYANESSKEIARLKQFSNARRIFEIDDYIIDPPKKNDHVRNWPADTAQKLSQAIGLCDRLVVSTEPLADALSHMHQDIRVVPNMLAASLWAGLTSERQTSIKPRVGWAGGTSHRGDLELMLDVVKCLADEVDWVFFGMCPDILRPYVKEFHRGVPLAQYPQKLASLNLDLALAPLEQNLFNDCKSNLRLLEYGVCGFPVICTDTRAYAGYLPCTRVRENSTEQWLEAIRMHLSDPQASYRQGDALREVVLRDYLLTPRHLQHWANAWLAD